MDVKGKLFQESLKKIELPFKLSGIPLYLSDNYTTMRLLLIFHFVTADSALLADIAFLCNGIANGVDFVRLTFSASCVGFTLLTNVKIISLLLNESKLRVLIDGLIELEEISKRHGLDRVFDKDRKSFHNIIYYFNVVYLFLFLAFLLAPLSIMTLSYIDGHFKLIYPLELLYPFDHFHSELYPIVFLHQACSVMAVLIFVSSSDYFFYLCCLYISIQFKLLQMQFENIIPGHKIINLITYTDIETKFMELVEWHQKVISLTATLEAMYARPTLNNFVSSSAVICLTLFNVTALKDIAFVITFLFFLSMCLVQIYLLCFFGDKVSQASTDVSTAVYNSMWYLSDSSVGKHLLFVQIRSQKPCKLTAMGFAEVNLRAFMRILSNAWSYFALLKTMYH